MKYALISSGCLRPACRVAFLAVAALGLAVIVVTWIILRSSLPQLDGQSGHPLSPYYRAGHEAWERGDPMPLLPAPPRMCRT